MDRGRRHREVAGDRESRTDNEISIKLGMFGMKYKVLSNFDFISVVVLRQMYTDSWIRRRVNHSTTIFSYICVSRLIGWLKSLERI